MEIQQTAKLKCGFQLNKNKEDVEISHIVDNHKNRSVGIKLSEGMNIPKELVEKFKFASQKSKLAGTIHGSFFVIKDEY